MHIASLYIHPIKSLLPVAVQSAQLTALGLAHDRTFVLLRAATGEPLHIGRLLRLCLFAVALSDDSSSSNTGVSSSSTMTVTFTPTGDTLRLPLVPAKLGGPVEVVMHGSACTGHRVSTTADTFFSAHLGFAATLVFLGASRRRVLGNLPSPPPGPDSNSSWYGLGFGFRGQQNQPEITFADCAPLLVTTTPSLAEVSARCSCDIDTRKFRPNIVVAPGPHHPEGPGGADGGASEGPTEGGEEAVQPFEEDYWAEITITPPGTDVGTPARGHRVQLTANCARCNSINVDFATGSTVAPAVQPLKKLMGDRRVDAGMKFSPIFGRYGFVAGMPLCPSGVRLCA